MPWAWSPARDREIPERTTHSRILTCAAPLFLRECLTHALQLLLVGHHHFLISAQLHRTPPIVACELREEGVSVPKPTVTKDDFTNSKRSNVKSLVLQTGRECLLPNCLALCSSYCKQEWWHWCHRLMLTLNEAISLKALC